MNTGTQMAGFFKSFGKGILYLFILPLLIVVLAFYGIIGLGGFIFMFFKSVVLFFTGRSLHDDLPEDKKAKEILNRQVGNFEEEKKPETPAQEDHSFSVYQPSVDPFSTRESTTDPYNAPTVEEGLFGRREEPSISEPQQEMPQPEPVAEPTPAPAPVQEPTPAPAPFVAPEQKELHEISTSDDNKYRPKGSESFLMDIDKSEFEDDDDNGDSGISFDSF